jgi:excisionase family DNA binding protein
LLAAISLGYNEPMMIKTFNSTRDGRLAMKEERLLNANQVAQLLSIPVSTVYYYAATLRILPSIKFGRQRRFKKSEVLKWLETQQEVTNEQA